MLLCFNGAGENSNIYVENNFYVFLQAEECSKCSRETTKMIKEVFRLQSVHDGLQMFFTQRSHLFFTQTRIMESFMNQLIYYKLSFCLFDVSALYA